MTIKAVFFDLDGVLVKEYCYYSKIFREKFGVPEKEFYQIMLDNKMIQRTKKDGSNFKLFSDLIKKYNVKITEDEFFEAWLTNFRSIDEVVEFAKKLKNEGLIIGVLSDNFLERAEYFRTKIDWFKIFNYTQFSSDYGNTKHDRKFFEILLENIELKPEEVIFTDDDPENIEVTKSVGIHGITFESLDQLKEEVDNLLRIK